MTGCISDKPGQGDLPYIDVRKSYPEKEILLTDIADVSYVHLSTSDDDYLYNGWIHNIGENTIFIYNPMFGTSLFFTKDGNPKSHFNRSGQGPEEHRKSVEMIYDEAADEVFAYRLFYNVIQVYSSTGMFKRKITLPQGMMITQLIVFDDHSLFFFDNTYTLRELRVRLTGQELSEDCVLPFYRISKTDGKVLDCVELPCTRPFIGINYEGRWQVAGRFKFPIKCSAGALLWNAEADTIFLYTGDKSLTPVFCQIPRTTSLNPMEYLDFYLDRGQYQFITVSILRDGELSHPRKYYMRNKKTGEVVHPKLLLPDYKGKELYVGTPNPYPFGEAYYEKGCIFELDLYELKEADRENRLSGKLKELVATLNEDEDNNVFVLVDFK